MRPGTLAVAVPLSQNAKIGEAATTYAAQTSCPSDCVFFDGGGCYAETGAVGKFVTAPLNRSAAMVIHSPLDVARAEAAAIDALSVPEGRPLRLHTVGDCPTDDCARVVAAAAERYMDRGGGPVWTYTHAWRDVARPSWGRVSVLASCETPEDVALARGRGYAPALVVEEFRSDSLYELGSGEEAVRLSRSAEDGEAGSSGVSPPRVAGAKVLPCPAQTRNVPCSDCRLCFNDGGLRERGYAIGFEVHGIPFAKRQARLALAARAIRCGGCRARSASGRSANDAWPSRGGSRPPVRLPPRSPTSPRCPCTNGCATSVVRSSTRLSVGVELGRLHGPPSCFSPRRPTSETEAQMTSAEESGRMDVADLEAIAEYLGYIKAHPRDPLNRELRAASKYLRARMRRRRLVRRMVGDAA